MKRYLIIFATLVVLIGVGVVVYFYFNHSPEVAITPGGTTTLPQSGNQTTNTEPPTGTVVANNPAATVSPRLVQVSKGPVVPGMVLIDKKTKTASTSDVAIQFIERQSGNVFSYLKEAKTLTRISNKTIPGIQSAAWTPSGSLAFVRYLSPDDEKIINTYALAATSTTGFFLAQNLSDITVSSTSVVTLASGVNGSVATIVRTDGTHPSTLFTTPLSALRLMFSGKNNYLAYTKPSGSLLGDAFLYDSSGVSSRIAGPLYGLAALASPLGKWVLISYTVHDALQMELINTSTHESITLPVATLADKCVWTSDDTALYCGIPNEPPEGSMYPDDWYQGVTSFTDRIWKIQVAGRYAELILDFSRETNTVLDTKALAIDPLQTTLVFMNKNDGSLWSYSL